MPMTRPSVMSPCPKLIRGRGCLHNERGRGCSSEATGLPRSPGAVRSPARLWCGRDVGSPGNWGGAKRGSGLGQFACAPAGKGTVLPSKPLHHPEHQGCSSPQSPTQAAFPRLVACWCLVWRGSACLSCQPCYPLSQHCSGSEPRVLMVGWPNGGTVCGHCNDRGVECQYGHKADFRRLGYLRGWEAPSGWDTEVSPYAGGHGSRAGAGVAGAEEGVAGCS